MKSKTFLIVWLSTTVFINNICMGNDKQFKPNRYIWGAYLGSVGGLFIALGGSQLFGLSSDDHSYGAALWAVTVGSIGTSIGSCIGTTIVANNKWKVFKINFAVAAISSLLCFSTKAVRVGSLLGIIIVPIFSAANAYRIDKQDYYSKAHNSQQEYIVGHANLMKDPFESMIQGEIINERQNYTPMGQRINVVKMPLLSVSW